MRKFFLLTVLCLGFTACAGGQQSPGIVGSSADAGDERVFSGSLTHGERAALPEQVRVRVGLYRTGQGGQPELFAESSELCPGRAVLPFRVIYRVGDVGRNADVTLRAEVLAGDVPFLESGGAVAVNLAERPVIRTRRVNARPAAPLALEETYWRLLRLDGQPARVFPGQSVPHLILRADGQATGSDGCNNYFSPWSQSGQALQILPGRATLMACPAGMEQGAAMMRALSQADSWDIQGARLLLSGKGKLLVEFEAVTLHE